MNINLVLRDVVLPKSVSVYTFLWESVLSRNILSCSMTVFTLHPSHVFIARDDECEDNPSTRLERRQVVCKQLLQHRLGGRHLDASLLPGKNTPCRSWQRRTGGPSSAFHRAEFYGLLHLKESTFSTHTSIMGFTTISFDQRSEIILVTYMVTWRVLIYIY